MSSAFISRLTAAHPLFRRHAALGSESDALRLWLAEGGPPRTVRPKATLTVELGPGAGCFIATGWVGRAITIEPDRRQIIDLLLPGDALGFGDLASCRQSHLVALTGVQVLASPRHRRLHEDAATALMAAVDEAVQMERARHVRHMLRLGVQTPEERLCDLFLEIHGRLADVGLAAGGRMPMPLSQPILASIIGVSPVHLNRTLRALRLALLVTVERGQAVLDVPAIRVRFPHLTE